MRLPALLLLLLPLLLAAADPATGAALRAMPDYPAAKPLEVFLESKGQKLGKATLTFGENGLAVSVLASRGFGPLPFTMLQNVRPYTCSWSARAEGSNAAGESATVECQWSYHRVPDKKETQFSGTISIIRKDGSPQIIALSAALPYPPATCWSAGKEKEEGPKEKEKNKEKAKKGK